MQIELSKLQTFIDNLADGILVIDQSNTILLYNDEAVGLLDTSVEEILADSRLESIFGNILTQAIDDAYEGRRSHIDIKRNGRYLRCGVSNVDGLFGEGKQAVITMSDVFSLKRLEEVKKEFISAILHKIRSPLATLKTSLSVLHEYQSTILSDDARDVLDMGRHEVDRLNTLLNSLRDLFIIETGLIDEELVNECIPMGSALESALKNILPLHKDILSRVKIEGDLSINVVADFQRFCRVLENVLANALSYSSDIVYVTLSSREKVCDIRIKDFGIGISEESMSMIFTKYFREDNPLTRSNQGNGLGLYIARAWMESMSGSISIESIRNQGTIAFLTIPLSDGVVHG